jgi:DNA-binding transcriptional LysR family regulator
VALHYAERILGLASELDLRLAEMTRQIGGPLLVGGSTTFAEFVLPRILAAFKAAYPEVQPRLVGDSSETIENRVAEHTLDVGIVEHSRRHHYLQYLQYENCFADELRVICCPGSPLASAGELTAAQLQGHPYVARESGCGTREATDRYFQDQGVPPQSLNTAIELGSPEAVKGAVETGLGFGIVSVASVAKERQLGTLVAIPLQPRLTCTLAMVFPRERFRSRLVNAFADFAAAKLALAGAEIA